VATGASECPLPNGRGDAAALVRGLAASLAQRFGAVPHGEKGWVLDSGYALTVNRRRARAARVDPARVAAAAKDWVASQPGVARVWTAQEIAAGTGPEPFATLYRNSQDPERAPDLMVQPVETCLVSTYPEGTSHGSPYLYDRAVPVLFAGPGVEPGVVRGRAAPVDVGPSLAALLGVPTPPDLDGRALPLRAR
jgi:hypothetical protein